MVAKPVSWMEYERRHIFFGIEKRKTFYVNFIKGQIRHQKALQKEAAFETDWKQKAKRRRFQLSGSEGATSNFMMGVMMNR